MTEQVVLSGATGFIAGHTIELLLAGGYHVVATMRDPAQTDSVAHLTALPDADKRLELVQADLTTDGAFDAYVRDADYVLHMASPYIVTVRNPQRDLLEPALRGTMSMLESCSKANHLKRVVLTSSMAAITDEPDDAHMLTEDDWNEKSSLSRNPYYYSKVRAEKAAWDYVARHSPAWDLVVINPFMVMGPSMSRRLNESTKIVADMLNGKFPAIMPLTWGIVDVRDVAKAHVLAMTAPSAAGRYICAAQTRPMRAIVDLLKRSGFSGSKLPSLSMESALGTKIAYGLSYVQPKGVGTYLRTHLDRTPRFDNSKIRHDLKLEFRDVDATIVDTAVDLAHWGHTKKPQPA